MIHGFLRVAAATPVIRTADCFYNADQILACVDAAPEDTALLVFPELCLTGYTCGDLFLSTPLLTAAESALRPDSGGHSRKGSGSADRPACIGGIRPVQLRRCLPAREFAGTGAQNPAAGLCGVL